MSSITSVQGCGLSTAHLRFTVELAVLSALVALAPFLATGSVPRAPIHLLEAAVRLTFEFVLLTHQLTGTCVLLLCSVCGCVAVWDAGPAAFCHSTWRPTLCQSSS